MHAVQLIGQGSRPGTAQCALTVYAGSRDWPCIGPSLCWCSLLIRGPGNHAFHAASNCPSVKVDESSVKGCGVLAFIAWGPFLGVLAP